MLKFKQLGPVVKTIECPECKRTTTEASVKYARCPACGEDLKALVYVRTSATSRLMYHRRQDIFREV